MPTSGTRTLVVPVAFAALGLSPGASWLAPALTGCFVIYLWTRPSARDLTCATAVMAALLVVRGSVDRSQWSALAGNPSQLGFFAGFASLIMLASRPSSPAFRGALCMPLFVLVRYLAILALNLDSGPSVDGRMLLLDHSLGDPAYRLGQWLEPRPALTQALWLLYWAVPLTLPLAFGAALEDSRRRHSILFAWGMASALALVCYHIWPVAGPRYAFSGWPALPRQVSSAPMDVPEGLLRTGMPSLHLTWAILMWRLAPDAPRWLRVVLGAFVGITVATTLGLGQHFLVDLLLALPFTVIILWLTSHIFRRGNSYGPEAGGSSGAWASAKSKGMTITSSLS
jgi:hypothetical protein